VVNKALEVRDEVEHLLRKEDRERFVTFHSQYLDEISNEVDDAVRQAWLRHHLDLLPGLRPEPPTE
jgi:hypothetical protein